MVGTLVLRGLMSFRAVKHCLEIWVARKPKQRKLIVQRYNQLFNKTYIAVLILCIPAVDIGYEFICIIVG